MEVVVIELQRRAHGATHCVREHCNTPPSFTLFGLVGCEDGT